MPFASTECQRGFLRPAAASKTNFLTKGNPSYSRKEWKDTEDERQERERLDRSRKRTFVLPSRSSHISVLSLAFFLGSHLSARLHIFTINEEVKRRKYPSRVESFFPIHTPGKTTVSRRGYDLFFFQMATRSCR